MFLVDSTGDVTKFVSLGRVPKRVKMAAPNPTVTTKYQNAQPKKVRIQLKGENGRPKIPTILAKSKIDSTARIPMIKVIIGEGGFKLALSFSFSPMK